MTYSAVLPEISSLGRFISFFTRPTILLRPSLLTALYSTGENDSEEEVFPPAPDVPVPDEDEIFPNRKAPQEEEYLPDEDDVVIEEPTKEGVDPYFPGKGDDVPLETEEEFPQTDPR